MQTNLLPDTSTMAVIVFQIWKFEPSAPFLVAMIAKDMKCASFPNLALSTLLELMNVLVTFNAHLSVWHTPYWQPFVSVFYPILSCLIAWYYIMQYNLHFFVHTLFWWNPSDWLLFLSRDVFVSTRIKTRVVFPDPPLLTPDKGPSFETSIFPLSFQGVREPLPGPV